MLQMGSMYNMTIFCGTYSDSDKSDKHFKNISTLFRLYVTAHNQYSYRNIFFPDNYNNKTITAIEAARKQVGIKFSADNGKTAHVTAKLLGFNLLSFQPLSVMLALEVLAAFLKFPSSSKDLYSQGNVHTMWFQ